MKWLWQVSWPVTGTDINNTIDCYSSSVLELSVAQCSPRTRVAERTNISFEIGAHVCQVRHDNRRDQMVTGAFFERFQEWIQVGR